MNSEQPSSLYSICFKRTSDVLKTGIWNTVNPNPFSALPPIIINDLLKYVLSLPFRERPRITELLILITSGRLSEIDLIHYNLELNPSKFLEIISRDACKNLRSFGIPAYFRDADNPPLEDVLCSCTKLEDIHSSSPFDLGVLKNCTELRNLRFHVPLPVLSVPDGKMMGAYAKFLTNLEVFSICSPDNSSVSIKFVSRLLLSCPRLISIGLFDSSSSIKLIHKTKTNIPFRFQLRRCFWGLSNGSYSSIVNTRKISIYKEKFPKIIKLAALSCPYVEELIINVFHKECLQYLCLLKHLTFLSINFNYCDGTHMSVWYSILKQIGPQLKHLSFEGSSHVPVNAICDNCNNLESLRIRGKATASTRNSTSPNLPNLRRIILMCMDEQSLMLLLSKCHLLEEMYLDCALSLDDNLLSDILKHNPLSELKVAGIHACKLSKLGFRMLLESAVKIEKGSFGSVRVDAADVIQKLNPKIVNYRMFNKLKENEFFRRKLHQCRF